MTTSANREWTEKYFAEHGVRMTGEHWAAIETAVNTAPPIPDEVITRLTAVVRRVPLSPPAGAPSTRTHPERRPRSRRASRAA